MFSLGTPSPWRNQETFRSLQHAHSHPLPYVALGPHGISLRRPDPWLRAISGTFYIYSESI